MRSTEPFTIRKIAVRDHGCHYETFLVEGYLNGRRVRKKFQRHEEAIGEKAKLDVDVANSEAALRVIPTRLSEAQIAEAEFCFRRLHERATLSAAVEWDLCNYRPPAIQMDLSSAQTEFLKSKLGLVKPRHLAEIRRQLSAFTNAFPGRSAHTLKRPEIRAYLEIREDWGPKTWNNVRGSLAKRPASDTAVSDARDRVVTTFKQLIDSMRRRPDAFSAEIRADISLDSIPEQLKNIVTKTGQDRELVTDLKILYGFLNGSLEARDLADALNVIQGLLLKRSSLVSSERRPSF